MKVIGYDEKGVPVTQETLDQMLVEVEHGDFSEFKDAPNCIIDYDEKGRGITGEDIERWAKAAEYLDFSKFEDASDCIYGQPNFAQPRV